MLFKRLDLLDYIIFELVGDIKFDLVEGIARHLGIQD
jgi:hypothetical protein